MGDNWRGFGARYGKRARKSAVLCFYCGLSASTVDHMLPRAKGGGDSWHNLVPACERCNTLKADMTVTEFKEKYPVLPETGGAA